MFLILEDILIEGSAPVTGGEIVVTNPTAEISKVH